MIPIKGRGFANQGSGLGFRMQPLILQEGYQYGVQDLRTRGLTFLSTQEISGART